LNPNSIWLILPQRQSESSGKKYLSPKVKMTNAATAEVNWKNVGNWYDFRINEGTGLTRTALTGRQNTSKQL
jgi:hypothetical protein